MERPRVGWSRRTSATSGVRSGCPNNLVLRDWEAWSTSAHDDATPTLGPGSTCAIRLLPQARAARLRGFFAECPRGPREDRSRGVPRPSRTCLTPAGAPHCGFPTRRGCRFGWSVGRCSCRSCAAAHGRPPSSVPNPLRCAARRPRRQGWSLWGPSRPRASGTSKTTAKATPQTCTGRGCCRSKSP